MSIQYRYRKQILGIIILLLLVIGGLVSFFLLSNNERKEKPKEKEKNLAVEWKKEEGKEDEKETVLVDIKGAIVTPGTYEIELGLRVIDVIEKAGGLREDADTSVINLSKKVEDEMVIFIYTQEEVSHFVVTKGEEQQKLKACLTASEVENGACREEGGIVSTGKVNLNQASKEELMMLPGIGESKAEEIIRYREEHGDFQTIEEVKNVNGIGDNLFAQIAENLTL